MVNGQWLINTCIHDRNLLQCPPLFQNQTFPTYKSQTAPDAGTFALLQHCHQDVFSDNVQHNKPHFHVCYAEHETSVGVDGELMAGSLPVKQLRLVQAWAAIHEEELYRAWNQSVKNQKPDKIEPLT